MSEFKKTLYSNLDTITVEEYQKYLDEAENKYISIKPHPEDENIVILNYTEHTTFERRWNHETMTARGLILDITSAKDNGLIYILAKPFPKFFNYGENPDYEKDIAFLTETPFVMEKMDGSLGISYYINDEIRFATRGSFTSEQAIKATELWKEKYEKYTDYVGESLAPATYLVEIIYPENRVVVDYKGKEELVLLGVNYLFANYEESYRGVVEDAKRLHMPVAKLYKFKLNELLEKKKSISANEEGWVLRYTNGKRLKIKGDEYLQVHRIIHGLSEKAKYKAFADGTLKDLIKQMPEEFREEIEDLEKRLEQFKKAMHYMLSSVFYFSKSTYPEKRDFAIHVTSTVEPEFRKFMFEAFKVGHIREEMIREHIYKNYKEYRESIMWNENNQDS